MTVEYDETGKIVLDHIYNQPDPVKYFTTLAELDYSIPGEAAPIFRKIIEARRAVSESDELNIIDLGCSYGVNAAILKHGLSMSDLYARYTSDEIADLSQEELIRRDRTFYADRLVDPDLSVTGVDVADNAVDYALKTQMMNDGVATNLETNPVPSSASDTVGSADLIISTGCVGYVRQPTFERILDVTNGESPWMAHFVLRMFPYEAFETLFAGHGYVTETLPVTFKQRRFASAEEQAHVLENLAELDIDPAGREQDGWYHAKFYLSRPVEAAAALPLGEVMSH